MPLETGGILEYREMGITEGYGTVYFSNETSALFARVLELQDGGKRIVYSINLAKNTNEFLIGLDNEIDYGFDLENADDVNYHIQALINYWCSRRMLIICWGWKIQRKAHLLMKQ